MDDDDVILISLLACVAAVHQIITAYTILFDDVPTIRERRLLKKRKRELTPYKRNVSARYSRPVSYFTFLLKLVLFLFLFYIISFFI